MKADGFSLIETLIALLILGISAMGLIRATEGHIDATRGIEDRAVALWVAENRLAELALPTPAPAGPVRMMDRDWDVAVTDQRSDDPSLRAVAVAVGAKGAKAPLVTLRGFVDRGLPR